MRATRPRPPLCTPPAATPAPLRWKEEEEEKDELVAAGRSSSKAVGRFGTGASEHRALAWKNTGLLHVVSFNLPATARVLARYCPACARVFHREPLVPGAVTVAEHASVFPGHCIEVSGALMSAACGPCGVRWEKDDTFGTALEPTFRAMYAHKYGHDNALYIDHSKEVRGEQAGSA